MTTVTARMHLMSRVYVYYILVLITFLLIKVFIYPFKLV